MGTEVAERPVAGQLVHADDWRHNREEARKVLQRSLYPGASDEAAELVLGYCAAARLDPFKKPVHIVPMSVKSGRKNADGDDIYENRDTIMPGIGLYRTDAARTGQYAGIDEPEFGPTHTLTFKKKVTEWYDKPQGGRGKRDTFIDHVVEYPEWCKVTVYRLINNIRCPFTAVEYWLENYATASRYTDAPNAMWEKRVRGQLAKVAEAQALRKAFPEVGAQPTAEEMEGRVMDVDEVRTIEPGKAEPGKAESQADAVTYYPADKFEKNLPQYRRLIESGKKTAADVIATVEAAAPLTDDQKKAINEIKCPEAQA